MKNALKELKNEKMLRSFIRSKTREIKNKHPYYTAAECVKLSMREWIKMN
jgi:hypothetical protein